MAAPPFVSSKIASYSLTNSNEINQTNAQVGAGQIDCGAGPLCSIAAVVMCPGAPTTASGNISYLRVGGIDLTPSSAVRLCTGYADGTQRAFYGEGLSLSGLQNWAAGRTSGDTWGWQVVIFVFSGDANVSVLALAASGVLNAGDDYTQSITSNANSTICGIYFSTNQATFALVSGTALVQQNVALGKGVGIYGPGSAGSVVSEPGGVEIMMGYVFSLEGVGGGDTTAPTITGPAGAAGAASISVSVAENTTACGTWTANETVTWSISGPDAALFSIGSTTGVLAFLSAPNFEAPGDAGANNTYDLTVTATDGASNASTQSVAINVTDAAEDGTNPSAPGAPTFASVTKNSATVNWTAATDNVGVAGYERRVAGGAIVDLGNVLTFNLSGGTPGASVLVEVRAYDAAGNRGPWASATLTYLIWGFDFDDPALDLEIGNVSGTLVGLGLLASTSWTVRVSDVASGSVVHTFAANTNAAGVLPRLQHAALDSGVYEVRGMTTEVDPLDRLVWAAILEATTP